MRTRLTKAPTPADGDEMSDVNEPDHSQGDLADDDTVRYHADDVARSRGTDTDHEAPADDDWDDMFEQLGVDAETAPAGSDDGATDVVALTGGDPTGPSITTIEQHPDVARNPVLESLWFRLSNPDFVTTALVPVPAVTSTEANEMAVDLAKVGASITASPVNVVTAVGLRPGEAAETSRHVADNSDGQTIVVVDSPIVDPGSIPILRSCPRVVLLVGLERSRGDALAGITDLIGADRVVGSVCLEKDKKRRWWHLRRR